MKRTKNSLTLILMLSSILLLLVLQFLWLQNVYKEAHDNFSRETSMLFRITVMAMQDTMIRKSITPYPHDGSTHIRHGSVMIRDSIKFSSPSDYFYDSVQEPKNAIKLQVYFMNGHKQELDRIIRPFIYDIQNESGPQNFLISLGSDSLNIDSIKIHFRNELQKAGIKAHFTIVGVKSGLPPNKADRKSLNTDYVHINPAWQYAAKFENTGIVLFREIMPQILFSVILTSLILISFYWMYRNIRSQQQLMELKNEFISNITHELKTPVATVSVAIEALKNFNIISNREKTDQYLDIAQKELNRLNLMMDKILKASVFELKGVEYDMEPVNLDHLVHQVVDSMKLVFESQKAEVKIVKDGSEFVLKGGNAHLGNVIYNLLDNALKYSHPGVSILIGLKSDMKRIELSVKDNGIGIPTEYHSKIFEKFSRIPNDDIHNVKGYGLGLNYVDKVVKSHRGSISVKSKPGEGSCFTLIFPKKDE